MLKKGLYFLSCLLSLWQVSWSQTEHYASQNFNTTSALLSGAVVGGEAGVSASFYNPSLISEIDENNLAINASLISITGMKLQNALGEGIDISNVKAKVQPRFLSYTTTTDGDRKVDMEMVVLTRISDERSAEQPYTTELDILTLPDGIEDYYGSLGLRKNYKDLWIGYGASTQISDKLHFGGSAFISVKTLKYDYGYEVTAQPQSDSIQVNGSPESYYAASIGFNELLNVWHVSLIFKFGIHYINPKESWEFGANLTLPSIGLFGSGKAQKKIFRTNIFNEFDMEPVRNFNLFQFDEKVKPKFKDPLSISVGFLHRFPGEKNILLFSAEYFHSLNPYEMIRSVSSPVTTEENQVVLEDEELLSYIFAAGRVFNVAIGFNKYLTEKINFLGGFRTDFSNQKNLDYSDYQNYSKIKVFPFNKYHLTSGINIKFKKIDFMTGFQYSYGRENNLPYLINMNDPVEYMPDTGLALQGPRENKLDFSFNEISLFFGFTYLFD